VTETIDAPEAEEGYAKPASSIKGGPPAPVSSLHPRFKVKYDPSSPRTALRRSKNMITAHVNEMGIVLRFRSVTDNLSPADWEKLLDQLKSHYLPSFYPRDKRCAVDFDVKTGQIRVVIYFTGKTVTLDESIPILQRWKMEVHDVRKQEADSNEK
jgi:hypothetical protein